MKLVLIPAGEFMMGSGETAEVLAKAFHSKADYFKQEYPQHRVRITKPFYMGQNPVTQAEYEQVMGRNPSWFTAVGRGKDKVAGLDTNAFPVEQVSWEAANEFCRRLSEKEGKRYRLPTEAQWEYACRAGSTTTYCCGDIGSELGEYAWYCDNSGDTTHPVGQKKPNAWGLYDMHGNVFQWCSDWFGPDYYNVSPAEDPKGAEPGQERVARGGGFGWVPGSLRSAGRLRLTPDARQKYAGFRVVFEIGAKQPIAIATPRGATFGTAPPSTTADPHTSSGVSAGPVNAAGAPGTGSGPSSTAAGNTGGQAASGTQDTAGQMIPVGKAVLGATVPIKGCITVGGMRLVLQRIHVTRSKTEGRRDGLIAWVHLPGNSTRASYEMVHTDLSSALLKTDWKDTVERISVKDIKSLPFRRFTREGVPVAVNEAGIYRYGGHVLVLVPRNITDDTITYDAKHLLVR
jgi:formylglycine-generating enzyme required for sulfatase activity